MNILYISTLCSKQKFKNLFEQSSIKPQQQAQKFHSLLTEGLLKHGNELYILSRVPINKSTSREINRNEKEVINQHITYQYLKINKLIFIKHIILFLKIFINTIKWSKKYKKHEKIIVCDILNLSISIAALLASKLCRVSTIAIVTDLPNYIQNYNIQRKTILKRYLSNLNRKLSNCFVKKYNYYLLLTEYMNKIVNPRDKPYVIIEGMVDLKMNFSFNTLQNKYDDKIILYAGNLREKYGLKNLIEAFIRIKKFNIGLWIYGAGDMENEINNYAKIDKRIKYFGVIPNEEVIQVQLKATLLVNPRPSIEEFTKYSFPSKNMEYMVSGTPVLTTPLQGMPNEYNEYVYLFEDESVEGMSKTIDYILSKSKEELHKKGLRAKEYVLKEKNNVMQAQRLLELIGYNS